MFVPLEQQDPVIRPARSEKTGVEMPLKWTPSTYSVYYSAPAPPLVRRAVVVALTCL